MRRTLVGCLAGIGGGFLLAFAIGSLSGVFANSDGRGFVLVTGIFLAGPGAVAGAIVGGVADLSVFFKRREPAGQTRERCRSKSEVTGER